MNNALYRLFRKPVHGLTELASLLVPIDIRTDPADPTAMLRPDPEPVEEPLEETLSPTAVELLRLSSEVRRASFVFRAHVTSCPNCTLGGTYVSEVGLTLGVDHLCHEGSALKLANWNAMNARSDFLDGLRKALKG